MAEGFTTETPLQGLPVLISRFLTLYEEYKVTHEPFNLLDVFYYQYASTEDPAIICDDLQVPGTEEGLAMNYDWMDRTGMTSFLIFTVRC